MTSVSAPAMDTAPEVWNMFVEHWRAMSPTEKLNAVDAADRHHA